MTDVPRTANTPYRSTSCRIGTHRDCAHSSPKTAPIGIPVIYEACSCSCHSTAASQEAGS